MAKIVTIINGKGGVAKTTTAKFLIGEYLRLDKKVLAIDLDPKQCNLSTGFNVPIYPAMPKDGDEKQRINAITGNANLVKIFQGDRNLEPLHLSNIHKNFWFIPAARELENASNSCKVAADLKLKGFLKTVENDFDVIVIDTNPGITVLQNNAILYADVLVMPSQAEDNSARGMQSLFIEIANLMTEYESDRPKKFVIVPSLYNKRSTVHSYLKEQFNHIANYIQGLSSLKDKEIIVTEPIPLREAFKKADLTPDIFFVQDFIDKYSKADRSLLELLSSIAKLTINLNLEDVRTSSNKK